MLNALLGFAELGVIILAWTILWNFLIKGITGIHGEKPWAQGLAAVFHA